MRGKGERGWSGDDNGHGVADGQMEQSGGGDREGGGSDGPVCGGACDEAATDVDERFRASEGHGAEEGAARCENVGK